MKKKRPLIERFLDACDKAAITKTQEDQDEAARLGQTIAMQTHTPYVILSNEEEEEL